MTAEELIGAARTKLCDAADYLRAAKYEALSDLQDEAVEEGLRQIDEVRRLLAPATVKR